MATYKQRLEIVLNHSLSSDWETGFARDLISRLDRKRSLSIGQRRVLDKVEKQLVERTTQATVPNKLGDEIKALIEGAEKGSYTLSAWQMSIMKSFRLQVLRGATLSEKQTKILDDVRQASNPVTQAAWKVEYKADYKEMADKLYEIYKDSQYWSNLWDVIGDGEVPDKSRFLRMFNHNRIQGLIKNMSAVPKYSVGDYVFTRAGATSWSKLYKIRRRNDEDRSIIYPFLHILKVNPTLPTTYARGGNTYLVNPVGTMETIVVEEREIRKISKKERLAGRVVVKH